MEIDMPRKQHNELKAGLFVLGAVAILFAVIIWLGATSIFDRPTGHAVFYASYSSGPMDLQKDFKVKLGDVEVGKISEIRDDPKNSRIIYMVDFYHKGLTVYSNGKVKVAAGLFGNGALALSSLGTPTDAKTGKEVPVVDMEHPIEITAGLSAAIDNFTKISASLANEVDKTNTSSLLSKVDTIVTSLEAFSKSIEIMAANLKPETSPKLDGSIIANIKTTTANLAKTTTAIDKYVEKDLGEIIVKIRKISTSILKTANNLNVSSEEVKQILVINRGNIDAMLDDMAALSANLSATSKEIRRNPWRLFYKPDDKKMNSINIYDAARSFDDGATRLQIAVTKLQSIMELAPTDPAAAKEIKKVHENLLEAFKKFQKVEDALWKELK
jgi:ABC-type transporter Mla subunit MlaD